ncbi:hypothetical protein [Crenothrix sp.]|uniref:hypothetical protein n=1 Tax=Crenothrix sp. TaxID=3100433 RepID=UPI00374D9F1B
MYSMPFKKPVSNNVVLTLKYAAIGLILCMGLHTPRSHADVVANFSGSSLNPNVHLDVANAGLSSAIANSEDTRLEFRLFGDVNNMWIPRNSDLFAWKELPVISFSNIIGMETKVSMPNSDARTFAGFAFYDRPKGISFNQDAESLFLSSIILISLFLARAHQKTITRYRLLTTNEDALSLT